MKDFTNEELYLMAYALIESTRDGNDDWELDEYYEQFEQRLSDIRIHSKKHKDDTEVQKELRDDYIELIRAMNESDEHCPDLTNEELNGIAYWLIFWMGGRTIYCVNDRDYKELVQEIDQYSTRQLDIEAHSRKYKDDPQIQAELHDDYIELIRTLLKKASRWL